MIDFFFLHFFIPDEDGSEFERELTEALEGLNVAATADKLSKVPTAHFCVLDSREVKSDLFYKSHFTTCWYVSAVFWMCGVLSLLKP